MRDILRPFTTWVLSKLAAFLQSYVLMLAKATSFLTRFSFLCGGDDLLQFDRCELSLGD
jgi:hypothetical protein